jgi:translation initiation factor IF-2
MEFIRAFVENSWARPGTERPATRVHVALVATMGVVLVAVVIGVILQILRPIKLTPAVAAPARTAEAPHYTAVSGWDCGTGADRGFDATGRTADWYTVARGGWAHDGCHGTFEAIPMSGDAHKFNENQSALWWFTPGTAMVRCAVAVYLPNGDQPADSAATAAQFFVTAGRNGSALAAFTIDETARRGAWQTVGTYPVSQGAIAVKLVNQGVPANPKARLAVTQVRVTCTG